MTEIENKRYRRKIISNLVRMHSSPLRWAFATAAFVIAFLIRIAIHDDLPAGFPFLTFFPAVILTAFVGGLLPGVLVAIASTMASWFYFISPHSFDLTASTALALGFFILIATVDLLVIHYMFKWLQELDNERARSRELATSLDLLFKEMQHRVSNNLALVGAMLRMQQKAVTDDASVRALREAADRVTLVGKIQRRLHDPEAQDIGLRKFIEEVCGDILEASGMSGDVHFAVHGDNVQLHSDQVAPVALIIAELFSNALEHAFDLRPNKRITVAITTEGVKTKITVHDNGCGVPEGFNMEEVKSLGLKVANQLSRQQGGRIDVTNDDGARFVLVIPNTQGADRAS